MRIGMLLMWLFAVGVPVPANAGDLRPQLPTPDIGHPIVDRSTLDGKVMVGYQGWFSCPGDGMNLGWTHWGRGRNPAGLGPETVTVDLWPDVSEYDADELYDTGFQHRDGRAAQVFSSANRKTVNRHFQWMQEYGIDGAFIQRFGNGLRRGDLRRQKNTVLRHARASAEQYGRAFAVMYDLSGMKAGSLDVVRDDWRALHAEAQITGSDAYLHHDGQPLVAIWGIGFSDRHQPGQYQLEGCRQLIRDIKASGCRVMLGIPTGWREQRRDAVKDPTLHEILKLADILSPWTVGRYRDPGEVAAHGQQVWTPDLEWCRDEQIDYLPVVFPGFSWRNLKRGTTPLDQIPRQRGEFFWSQIVAAKQAGARMIYVAMFDEVDEGTAIFKCTNEPPVGPGVEFLSYQGVPSDHYLKLAGRAGELIRKPGKPDSDRPLSSDR